MKIRYWYIRKGRYNDTLYGLDIYDDNDFLKSRVLDVSKKNTIDNLKIIYPDIKNIKAYRKHEVIASEIGEKYYG